MCHNVGDEQNLNHLDLCLSLITNEHVEGLGQCILAAYMTVIDMYVHLFS